MVRMDARSLILQTSLSHERDGFDEGSLWLSCAMNRSTMHVQISHWKIVKRLKQIRLYWYVFPVLCSVRQLLIHSLVQLQTVRIPMHWFAVDTKTSPPTYPKNLVHAKKRKAEAKLNEALNKGGLFFAAEPEQDPFELHGQWTTMRSDAAFTSISPEN